MRFFLDSFKYPPSNLNFPFLAIQFFSPFVFNIELLFILTFYSFILLFFLDFGVVLNIVDFVYL